MFMAPPDVESPWNNEGVPGCYRFLNRLWVLTHEYLDRQSAEPASTHDKQLLHAVHKAIKKVTDDIEAVKLNTAISAQMECLNELYRLKDVDNFQSAQWQFALESMVQLVAPFAPHIAEELWHELGHDDSVHVDHWPQLDEQYLVADTMTLAVQVNGKVRAEITVGIDDDEASIKKQALLPEPVQKYVGGQEPKKVIYVKGRLVSIVV
jgi:leucyl-tRNA synthetase